MTLACRTEAQKTKVDPEDNGGARRTVVPGAMRASVRVGGMMSQGGANGPTDRDGVMSSEA